MHSFAVLSDTSPVTTARLTRMIVHRDPQALLFLGDHHPRRFGVSGMSARSWRRSVGAPLRDAVIAVPGNHDHDRSNGLAGWSKIVDGAWPRGVRREGDLHCFYADAGAVRFIGLDTGPEAQGVSDFQRIVTQGISQQLLEWKGIEATEKLVNSQNSKIVVIGNPKNGLPLILPGQ